MRYFEAAHLTKEGFMLLVILFSISAYAQIDLFSPPTAVSHGDPIEVGQAGLGTVVGVFSPGLCSGTLLSDRVVLTARHCMNEEGTGDVVLPRTGSDCGTAIIEKTIYPNGSYPINLSDGEENVVALPDMALLKLKTPICGAKPAVLPNQPLQEGSKMRAAGFGRETPPGGIPYRIDLEVITMNRTKLQEMYSEYNMEPNRLNAFSALINFMSRFFVFALPLTEHASLCPGDSGGPAYQETDGVMTIVGVNGNSFSHRRAYLACMHGYLQGIAPVFPYRHWIEVNMAKWAKEDSGL